jgi:hypothetical protein
MARKAGNVASVRNPGKEGRRMEKHCSSVLATALLWIACGVAWAQGVPPGTPGSAMPAPAPAAAKGMGTLKGTWIRPDGGYQVVISDVGKDGRLEAMYFNPSPLPFAKASATKDGDAIRVSLELRAGGYDGSTYELVYDQAGDRLVGVYYQAVAKQKFNVFFVRRPTR